jgi:hypothetical protein
MRRVSLGMLSLVMLLGSSVPAVGAARSDARGKTIKDLSGPISLGALKRSVSTKFYQSLLVSPLDDWSVVHARVAGTRLSGTQVIRSAANPAYDSLALKFANEMTLVANERGGSAGQMDSALMHLLIYKIADGVMAVSFAYQEAPPGEEMKNISIVRLLVKTKEGRWTEIRPLETRQDKRWSLHQRGGRRLRRMDRMPMDAISVPRP